MMASGRGLEISSSKELKDLLSNAASNNELDENIREEAQRLLQEKTVTWRQLRPVYKAVRDPRQKDDQSTQQALKSSKLVIPSLPEKVKSPELKARLERLQREEDERKYQAMVADVTVNERTADAAVDSAIGTYKDQLGYGVHIIVVMGVFYLMGHLAASTFSSKLSMKAAGGLTGLIFAMLMEAVLLIIRTSSHHEKHRKKKRATLSSKPAGSLKDVAAVQQQSSNSSGDQKNWQTKKSE